MRHSTVPRSTSTPGGSFDARCAGVDLVGVAVSLSADGTLGQTLSLDLHVQGTGVVLETVVKIVRMTLDAAESIGATIVDFLGEIGCEILSWFGACDQWVDVEMPSTEWVEKLFSFDIHLATIQLPGSLVNSAPPPPNLASVSGGVLTLNVGSRAALRNVLPTNQDESYTISHAGGSAGNETIVVTAFGVSETYTGVSFVSADFGDGNDTFVVSPGVTAGALVYGGAGNDTLGYSGTGSATLYGGTGNDVLALGGSVSGGALYGGDGNDQLTAEISNPSVGAALYGDAGDDTLTGGAGADVLGGGDGNDLLQGRGGADTITGGAGNDTLTEYVASLGQGATFDGGSGTNQVKLLGTAGANSFSGALTARPGFASARTLAVRSAYLFAQGLGRDRGQGRMKCTDEPSARGRRAVTADFVRARRRLCSGDSLRDGFGHDLDESLRLRRQEFATAHDHAIAARENSASWGWLPRLPCRSGTGWRRSRFPDPARRTFLMTSQPPASSLTWYLSLCLWKTKSTTRQVARCRGGKIKRCAATSRIVTSFFFASG